MDAYPRQQTMNLTEVPERRLFYLTFAGVSCFAFSLARQNANDRRIPFLVLECAEEIERHPVPFVIIGADEFESSVVVFLDEPEIVAPAGVIGLDHVGNQDRSCQLLRVGSDLWIRAANPLDRAAARVNVSILSGSLFTRDIDMAAPAPEWELIFRNEAGEPVWKKRFNG